jgi:hypothetical protein
VLSAANRETHPMLSVRAILILDGTERVELRMGDGGTARAAVNGTRAGILLLWPRLAGKQGTHNTQLSLQSTVSTRPDRRKVKRKVLKEDKEQTKRKRKRREHACATRVINTEH